MQDVTTLLIRFGFILSRVRGSHHIFDYDDGERVQQLIVPLHGPRVKKFYVEQVVIVLDDLFPIESDIEDDDGKDD